MTSVLAFVVLVIRQLAMMSYAVSCHILGRKGLHSKAFQKLSVYFFIGQSCVTWLPPVLRDSREASVLAGYIATPKKISALLERREGECTVNKQLVVAATKHFGRLLNS